MIDLQVNQLEKQYGGLKALGGVSFSVTGAELIGLIGPNGAGKTTLTNILSGAVKPTNGTVYLNGTRIDHLPPHRVARAGLGKTFQVTRTFRRMTVLENICVPAMATSGESMLKARGRAGEILRLLTLEHLSGEYARVLSGGQQKLLELGRLLMLDPSLLILDEPFAGVHPRLMETIFSYIHRVNEEGKGIILISHQMDSIFAICRRLLVLHQGKIIADGDPQQVKKNPTVITAYLGKGNDKKAHADA